jgi:hypothetical protein
MRLILVCCILAFLAFIAGAVLSIFGIPRWVVPFLFGFGGAVLALAILDLADWLNHHVTKGYHPGDQSGRLRPLG